MFENTNVVEAVVFKGGFCMSFLLHGELVRRAEGLQAENKS